MCSGCSGDVERGDEYDELPEEVSPANPNWRGARAATEGELAFAAGVLAEEAIFAGVMSAPMSLAELTELSEEAGRVLTEAEAEAFRRRRDIEQEMAADIVSMMRRRGSL